MQKYKLHVSGTHCASCKILIEDILSEHKEIQNAKVDLQNETLEFESESTKSADIFADELTGKIKANGYTLSADKNSKLEKNTELKNSDDNSMNTKMKAVIFGIIFLFLFFILQKSGILNVGFGSKVTPTSSFIIGIIASLSSCLAIVGGLVLSLSAKVAKDDDGNTKSAKRPMLLFHTGRLLGFAVLGGILGMIGSAIGVSYVFSAILGMFASLVMIILGLNLFGIFKKNKMTLPSHIFSYFRKIEHSTLAPIVVGVGTFFLPCGFTQSMQISALSSGSFTSGFLIMLFFALGTLPVLALLSFSSVKFANSKYAPLFFKSAGVVVFGLGLFALLAGLASLGIIKPLFNI